MKWIVCTHTHKHTPCLLDKMPEVTHANKCRSTLTISPSPTIASYLISQSHSQSSWRASRTLPAKVTLQTSLLNLKVIFSGKLKVPRKQNETVFLLLCSAYSCNTLLHSSHSVWTQDSSCGTRHLTLC